jgi:hypothetical protein
MKRSRLTAELLAVIAGAVTFCGFSAGAREARPPSLDDPEAYAVYSTLLRTEWSDRLAHSSEIVFQQETRNTWECMPSGKALEAAWKPVIESFQRENAAVRLLRPGLPLGIPYVVIPSAEIQARIHDVPESPWSGFYERYFDSAGYMVVSAVGFDAPKQHAMVYMANFCGRLCGRGANFFAEKIGGVWRAVAIPGVTSCFWSS